MAMLRCRRRPSLAAFGLALLLSLALPSSPTAVVDARKRDGDPSEQCDCEPSITAAVEESRTQLVDTHQAALAEKDAAAAQQLAALRAELESVRSQRATAEAEAQAAQANEGAAQAEQACRLELADTVAKQNEAIQSERSARSLLSQAEAEAAKRDAESTRKLKELTKERDTSRDQVKATNDRYAEARRELMDSQRENRDLHQKLVSRYVNATLLLEDATALAGRAMAQGRDLVAWGTEAAPRAWTAARESADAAVQVVTPAAREVAEAVRTKGHEVRTALVPHAARLVERIGEGIEPHYRTAQSQIGQAYGDTVRPIVDDTVAPLYKEHVAPLVVRAGEVVESCRRMAVSGVEQGTAAMLDTISRYEEEVKDESPMRQRALAKLQWTHDNAEYCIRTITYCTGALVGLYLFGALAWRLALFVIKVGTSPIWVPFWLVYWIICKATGSDGGGKSKGGGVATANGTNGSHA
jgi:hypothetical protein